MKKAFVISQTVQTWHICDIRSVTSRLCSNCLQFSGNWCHIQKLFSLRALVNQVLNSEPLIVWLSVMHFMGILIEQAIKGILNLLPSPLDSPYQRFGFIFLNFRLKILFSTYSSYSQKG